MKQKQLFEQFLDSRKPCHVDRIEVDVVSNRVDVYILMDRQDGATMAYERR